MILLEYKDGWKRDMNMMFWDVEVVSDCVELLNWSWVGETQVDLGFDEIELV